MRCARSALSSPRRDVTAVLAAGAAKELGRRFAITRLDVFMSDRRARDERAPFHCPMPPVLLTERIAHLGTAEMTAITPPKIFSKEVAQSQATPFPRQDLLTARNRFRPNFRGWRLDEFSIFARPPPGGLAHVRADDLEAFPSGLGHTASGTTYLPTR